MNFERVALIGLGLIGSSLGHVIHQKKLAKSVVGYARSKATRARALEIGFIDEVTADASACAKEADLIVLCTPVGIIGDIVKEIAPSLKPGSVVTDVGSVKSAIVEQSLPHMPDGVFLVPGHPIAGTEQSGPDSGFAELFENRWCILTPVPDAQSEEYQTAVSRLTAFWEACGSRVDVMDPKHHDLVLAITSHVPHLIAYNIVGTAADLERVAQAEVIKYSASGFRDFTRIAASDPTMWRDVFLNNKDAVLEMLGRFVEDLSALQRAIRWDDGEALFDLFTRTRQIRRSIVEAGQDTAEPDFGRHSTPPKEKS